MKRIIILLTYLLVITITVNHAFGQEDTLDISTMTKEDVLSLTYDELLAMPFEDVLKLADIVGVSLEELYEMILNMDVVSASKKVESSFESPLSTSVISYNELKASGVRTIEEALRLIPGIIVREKTNGNFDIHIRGNDNIPPNHMFLYSENSITLVMIDGRPVYNYVHGGTFWETLPVSIEDIDRIEVVRGPSSALYGPNAVSGVVNIITKTQTSEKLSVDADVQAGNLSTVIANMGIGKAINDKIAFRITGNFQTFNRNTDEMYVHKANGGNGGFISLAELDTLSDPEQPAYKVFDPNDNVYGMFPDPDRARSKYGINGNVFYNVNENIAFDLKGGYQDSEVISSTMGDNATAQAGRESNTSYVDFNATIHGLHAQFNYLQGYQDIVKQDTGFKVDLRNINTGLEYDLILGNLNIRPGIFYQKAIYDDLPYLREVGQGFLNQERDFSTIAFSLRADYLLNEKLRLIGAVRGDKYSTHDNLYFSYQAIASYNLNEKHILRIVASRANRSPFLVDTYADYFWDREGRPSPGYIYFAGKENLDLLTMDMVEFGYRIKPVKNIQADIELYYTKTSNFGALYPDSVSLNGAQYGIDRPWVKMSYDNIKLETQQMGVTLIISWVAKENLVVKAFGSFQSTSLKDYIPYTQDETIALMLEEAYFNFLSDTTISSSTNFPQKRDSGKNKATPAFYGGLTINYSPVEKLNINLNSYLYDSQEFNSKYGTQKIESKLVLNLKASYSLWDKTAIYLNARNILGKKKEFSYMDDIGTIILIGLSLNL